jgi:hypothetical protein
MRTYAPIPFLTKVALHELRVDIKVTVTLMDMKKFLNHQAIVSTIYTSQNKYRLLPYLEVIQTDCSASTLVHQQKRNVDFRVRPRHQNVEQTEIGQVDRLKPLSLSKNAICTSHPISRIRLTIFVTVVIINASHKVILMGIHAGIEMW